MFRLAFSIDTSKSGVFKFLGALLILASYVSLFSLISLLLSEV